MKFIRNSNFFLVQTHVTPFFYFSFSDSNVFGRSVRHCSGIKAIRHLQFNIHSSLLQLKSFHHLSPNYISSFKSMNYYIYFFQIKMFVQDLTTITNEIKRMELPGTSIVPPSSSWFESCSVQCYIFIVLEIKKIFLEWKLVHFHLAPILLSTIFGHILLVLSEDI